MLTLGNRNELLLDDFLLDTAKNITFDVQRPVRHGLVHRYDKPWEGESCTYQSLIQHPETGKIYLYYRGSRIGTKDNDKTQNVCLAISEDGVHFERPDVGDDNVVLTGMIACHNLAPFYDTNPACKEDERFKALGSGEMELPDGKKKEVLMAFSSPDGIRWKLMTEDPVITDGLFDSLNTVFFDNRIGKYRCYSRYWTGVGYTGLRSIQSCESEDFLHWNEQKHNTYNGGNEPIFEFYTNSTRPVPGAPHQYVAMPMRFNPARKKTMEHPYPGVSDCMLMSSRDGYDWVLRDCRAWIYPGIDPRQWTQRNFIVGAGFVELDDTFHFYTTEHYCWDDCGLYHYSTPKFRLGYAYSLDGSFVTKPFRLEGDRLTFNYNTSAVGTLGVTVLDEAGEPIEGCSFEVYGNELAYPVDLAALKGRTLRLKVQLQDAYLYAIGY